MKSEYYELEHWDSLESAVERLLQWRETHKNTKAKIMFNGHYIYSDTVTMDGAYIEVFGKSKEDWEKARRECRDKLREEREEHKQKIPQLTKEWVEKGHKVLDPKFWETWDELVPIRLNDLYDGMELGGCLDIITTINEKSLEEAVEIMKSQGHSNASEELMKSMVRILSDKGEQFVKLFNG